MTAAPAAPAPRDAARPGAATRRQPAAAVRSAVSLAGQEAWHLVSHPAALTGLVLWVTTAFSVGNDGAEEAVDVTTSGPAWSYGVAMLFAGNLVASRDRRADSGELLSATPLSRRTRTAALLLGSAGPAAVCGAVVLLLAVAFDASGFYADPLTPWHLLQGPLTVLGAGLLGVMVARCAPVPGAVLLVLAALVTVPLLPDPWSGLGIAGWSDPGSIAWHCAYLAGLCAMAVAGALVPEARRPGRVVAVGAVLTGLTAAAGWMQLP